AYDAPKAPAKAEAAPHAAEVRPAEQAASADRPLPTVHAMQASLASAFPTVTAGTQPATDLSATLGQQVIDMSSGGQWIDGLAKEIATLASGTGQGSFRLSPEHLGPMRVDIRHGDLGAEISLTVQTAAAESALRQDSDKLKADAQLSAVRVHEVRVERVHNVAETARSDGAGNQNGGNNNGGASSWNQGGTQAAFSQSQGQSGGSAQANAQGQGNGQQGGRKVSGGDAVLNHAGPSDQRGDDAQDGVRRARYA
uniref:flagellar hook-length control protein FliK n=1 Tax=Sphingobium phenoxybenzoativorans TaxID=1592790 RepID=UPI001112FDE7